MTRLQSLAGAVMRVFDQASDEKDSFDAAEALAVLDSVRFAIEQNMFADGTLGQFFVQEAGEPEAHEIQRWEDDGGRVSE